VFLKKAWMHGEHDKYHQNSQKYFSKQLLLLHIFGHHFALFIFTMLGKFCYKKKCKWSSNVSDIKKPECVTFFHSFFHSS